MSRRLIQIYISMVGVYDVPLFDSVLPHEPNAGGHVGPELDLGKVLCFNALNSLQTSGKQASPGRLLKSKGLYGSFEPYSCLGVGSDVAHESDRFLEPRNC
jgi:hypothetical protein